MENIELWAAGLALVVLLVLASWLLVRRSSQRGQEQARALFQRQRDALHAEFFQRAAASGKPKGLRWQECQWEDWVEFVRHRKSGELVALVSLTILFEAIEGGDMEGVAAVGLPRNATAVFFYRAGRWETLGKVVFNKNPDEAAAHFHTEYDRAFS